jgi:catechol 2,3-dioxygenase-like lactoylglutathione lyase family enzyme
MTYEFHHIHVVCSDLDEMESFFVDVLGAELVERKTFGDVEGAVINYDGTPIYLREPRGGGSGESVGYDHLGLVVDDIEAAYEELKEKGFRFVVPPTGDRGRVAFFEGPDGVAVELFQPPS